MGRVLVDIGSISKSIKTKFGVDIKPASEFSDAKRISTGLSSLDMAIGGGVPVGSATIIEGRYASTKSALCYKIAGEAYNDLKLPVLLIHSELSYEYSSDFAKACGLPVENTLVIEEGGIEDALNTVFFALKNEKLSCVIIDSLAALKTKSSMDSVDSSKSFGAQAIIMNRFFNQLSANMPKENRPIVLCTQHLYLSPGPSGRTSYNRTGGQAQGYMAALIIRLSNAETQEVEIKGDAKGVASEPVFSIIKWEVKKNKLGPATKSGTYRLYMTDADFPMGTISDTPQALIYGVQCGLIQRAGGWYVYNGEKYHGESKLLKALHGKEKEIFEHYDAFVKNALKG